MQTVPSSPTARFVFSALEFQSELTQSVKSLATLTDVPRIGIGANARVVRCIRYVVESFSGGTSLRLCEGRGSA